ncbi:MAG: trypsin-like peptidase domain-containing protein [Bacillota bacterium]
MTNYHVIAGADELKVIVQGDREFKGTLVGGDQQTDLAVVQIKGEDLQEAAPGGF